MVQRESQGKAGAEREAITLNVTRTLCYGTNKCTFRGCQVCRGALTRWVLCSIIKIANGSLLRELFPGSRAGSRKRETLRFESFLTGSCGEHLSNPIGKRYLKERTDFPLFPPPPGFFFLIHLSFFFFAETNLLFNFLPEQMH